MISVIVPIYNTERYLRDCLQSIQNQSYTEFEAILVDDGSLDHSSEICREFERNDSRFHYYWKENGGAASARNLGIEKSGGAYIAFIDSDDIIEKDYLKTLHNMTAGNTHTIVQCGMILERNGEKTPLFPPPGVHDGKGFAELILKREMHIFLLQTTAGKMYNRAFIIEHGYRFDEMVTISEDCLFNTMFLLSLKSIALSDYTGYHYLQDHSYISQKKHTYHVVEQSIKVGNLTAGIRRDAIRKFDLSNDQKVKWGFHTAICKIYFSNADAIENGSFKRKEKKRLYDSYFPVMNYPVEEAINDFCGIKKTIIKLSVKKRRRMIGFVYKLRWAKARIKRIIR